MNTTVVARLMGMTVTLFILILTIKSELLDYHTIAWQLVLAIPFLFAALVANSKITDEAKLNSHRHFTLLVNLAIHC